MFRKLALVIAAVLVSTAAANATSGSSRPATFTCRGTLQGDEITDPTSDNILHCYIDITKKSGKKILSVCRDGDYCEVRATGWSGSGNRYLIDKVLSVTGHAYNGSD